MATKQTPPAVDDDEWTQVEQTQVHNVKTARSHLLGNGVAYLGLFVIEFWLAAVGHSQGLRADAFNNFSGIVSSVLLALGLSVSAAHVRSEQAHNHLLEWTVTRQARLVRFRLQTIFTLLSGLIMLGVAGEVFWSAGQALLGGRAAASVPSGWALAGAVVATVVMLAVWLFNRAAAKRLDNAVLKASATDSLTDALTSLGVAVSIGGALLFDWWWLDSLASIVVGGFILVAGWGIVKDSSLHLIDYVDPKKEQPLIDFLEKEPAIGAVTALDCHYSSNLVTVNAFVTVSPDMTVAETFYLAEHIEQTLLQRFGIIDTQLSFVPDETVPRVTVMTGQEPVNKNVN